MSSPTPSDLPASPPSRVSPDALRGFGEQLTRGEDVIDPSTFARSIPQFSGLAQRRIPRVR